MKILIKESIDKKIRQIVDIPKHILLENLKDDHEYIEVINGFDDTSKIRVFFDIDDKVDMLTDILDYICKYFSCEKSDWAISCGNRENKISYHILSRKFCTSIQNLKNIHKQIGNVFSGIDSSVLFFSMYDSDECMYFRLPNQSKNSINKPAPPMKIIQGNLEDFLVTYCDHLVTFI